MSVGDGEQEVDRPTGERASAPPVASQVFDVVMPRYYEAVLASSADARERAQRAYVIASAIAAALVTAGAFAGIGDRPILVQIAGVLALGLWLVAASLFMHAVGAPSVHPGPGAYTDRMAFLKGVLEDARRESDAINRRQDKARYATFGAVAVTVAALSLGVFLPRRSEVSATLGLSPEAMQSVAAVCGTSQATLRGKLQRDALERDFVRVLPSQGPCRGTTIELPRAQVRVVAKGE